MKIDARSSSLFIGMALFAMFFGSGNLIYPLFVGTVSQGAWMSTALGFLIAAVLLPFLGVVAMVLYKGSYEEFFKTIGRRNGFILGLILLTVWIPLGSGPRCISVAYASIASYFSYAPSPWIFGLGYSALLFFLISRKLSVLDILGKCITPLLLFCVLVIGLKGFSVLPATPAIPDAETSFFFNGLVEGYNTMDLIASFFFSASVIHILRATAKGSEKLPSLVLKSSLIGMFILTVVYICLISLSAYYAPLLEGVPKERLLSKLAQILLGPTWSIVAIAAIILACFSTSVALMIAYADFLHEEIFKKAWHPNLSVIIAIAVSFVMSLFGLEGVTFVTAPVLKICYPVLLGLILFNMGKYVLREKKEVTVEQQG